MGAPRIEQMDKNLLINGNFDYWQRGNTVNGPSVYGPDRFKGDSVGLAQVRRDRTFSAGLPNGATYGSEYSTAAGPSEYSQRIESGALVGYVGRHMTFSCKAGLVSGAPTGMVIKTRTPDVKDTYGTTVTVDSPTLPPPVDHALPYTVYAYTFLVTQAMADRGVQLSVQPQAVAFGVIFSQMMVVLSPDGNDYVPTEFPYASRGVFEELPLCQRYFNSWGAKGTSSIGNGAFITASIGSITVAFPNEMRVVPIIGTVLVGNFRLNNATNNYTVASVSATGSTTKTLAINLNTTVPGNNGAAIASMTHIGGARLTADAEI